MAKNPKGQAIKLSAECWPLQLIIPKEYAKVMALKMAERGIEVYNVILEKGNHGDIVTLRGTAGKDSNKHYIRFESFFGQKTRLDIVVIEKSPIPSKEHLDFINSVRFK